jgi:hypothetical protein
MSPASKIEGFRNKVASLARHIAQDEGDWQMGVVTANRIRWGVHDKTLLQDGVIRDERRLDELARVILRDEGHQ